VRKVQALPVSSPIRQLFLDAFDLGWTIPDIAVATGITEDALYRMIAHKFGLCRTSTLVRLRSTITVPPQSTKTDERLSDLGPSA
jgi:AraC-like DNA-binding protein